MNKKLLGGFLLTMALPVLAFANADALENANKPRGAGGTGRISAEEFLASLEFKSGNVMLPGEIATLNLPERLRYLSPADSERVLVNVWGNPPGNRTLGMIVPANISVFDDGAWAAIITYEEEGHVSDDAADELDYAALLTRMQEEIRAGNPARVGAGYAPIELVGWAASPHYDSGSHKLYWAKELRFGDADISTLNYNVRILGRKGVLVLNLIGTLPLLPQIESAIPEVLAMTNFTEGNRYRDFDPGLDEVAAYGIVGLIAGKAAAKTDLLAKLGVILFSLKKNWLVVVLGFVALAGRVVRRRKEREAAIPAT